MKTVIESLRSDTLRVTDLLKGLLAKSSIHRFYNPATASVVLLGGHYAWDPLGDEGRRIQAKALEEYRTFHSTLTVLLREQPEDTLSKLSRADRAVLGFIEQKETLFKKDAGYYFSEAEKALQAQADLLERLYGSADRQVLVVPDTNALIFNPVLQNWRFDGIPKFAIVFTAPVLSELDGLKINHRNDAVRRKAESVINQLKEFRRRALAVGEKLGDGAELVSGVSRVMSTATEPRMEHSLQWLDPANIDDRLLASSIEVMRRNARSPVFLVTRDINLQNKADLARVPFLEPPDPI